MVCYYSEYFVSFLVKMPSSFYVSFRPKNEVSFLAHFSFFTENVKSIYDRSLIETAEWIELIFGLEATLGLSYTVL